MLGSDLRTEALAAGHEVIAPTRDQLNLIDPVSVAQLAVEGLGRFDAAINCAAYTAVDRAESDIEAATDLNAIGPGLLAGALAMVQVPLMHISTDFVFGESNQRKYGLDEEHPVDPLGVYGRTKLDGEIAVLAYPNWVVRTSWLFGPNGSSFPRTMVRLFQQGKPLRVVADQFGTPTYTRHLAQTLLKIIAEGFEPGLYHAGGPEIMSWHQFACRTLRTWSGHAVEIEAIGTEDYPTAALRPRFSALRSSKGVPPMPPLDVALEDFCQRLRQTANI